MLLADLATTTVAGVVFGLALAAPPGPMNAVIAEESVVRGWTAGFTAGLGAMTADLIFFVLSLAGAVAVLEEAPTLRAAMIGVGGLVMLYFAYGAVVEAMVARRGDRGSGGNGNEGRDGNGDAADRTAGGFTGAGGPVAVRDLPDSRGFRKALVLALTNPYQVLFWLTVGIGLLEPGTVDVFSYVPVAGESLAGLLVVRTGSPALLVGLFGGIVVWIVSFPALLVSVGRRVDAFAPAVAALSAVVLAGFGVTFCWTALAAL
mgnify:CR=1 FL=1